MAKKYKRNTVSVSDLANYAANPDGFYEYKTKRNVIAIEKGLSAHGHNYRPSRSYTSLLLIIFIIFFLFAYFYLVF